MNKKLKSLLNLVWAPWAIGIYVTVIVTFLCFSYFGHRDVGVGENSLWHLALRAHQVSIDTRLRIRGPEKGAEQVALLVVDEKAVDTVGRWPWPREVLAQGIENTIKYGAKVLAFDIVFSEPTQNVGKEIYNKIHEGRSVPPDIANVLQEEMKRLDSDNALATVFEKYPDKIVAGSVSYEGIDNPTYEGYHDFCKDLAFKRSEPAKLWDNEETQIAATDVYQMRPPRLLNDLFVEVLKAKEDEVRGEFANRKLSKKEENEMNTKLMAELDSECHDLLEKYADVFEEAWQTQILPNENPNEFKFKSFKEWSEAYKAQAYPNAVPVATDWIMNIPMIAMKTKNTGYFNAIQDSDGTLRSNRLILRSGLTYFPSIGLKSYLLAKQQNANLKIDINPATQRREVIEFELTDNETGDVVGKIPTDGQGTLMINYAGPQKTFPHISIAEMYSDSEDATIEIFEPNPKTGVWEVQHKTVKKKDWIKDKIFIVGATAIGIYDLRVTPFEKNYPGAETHANVISNLFSKKFMRTWDEERSKMPLIILIMGCVLSLMLGRLGALGGLFLAALSMGSVLYLDQHYLFNHGVVVTIIWPVMMISGVFITMTFYRYLTEERGKKELRQTFQKYVSPAIVEEILSDPKNIELGGRKTELTVFFSDVRGFTTISEKLDPRALSDLLNSYLTPMTEIVFKNRGTLDKYMGDAIMAFFGAPIHYNDHAKYACRCALQSLTKLFELQKAYEAKGLPTIDIGIGLNTGEVSVGNMGSETVRSYTVMGDAVNLASRLEGINKTYGTRIILSEFTYSKVKADFVCREVDWVRVKGKALPVKIFELIAEEKAPEKVVETLKWFQEGYVRYHEKSWNNALEAFTKALNVQPDDEVSKVYLGRCQEYLVEPPPDDWDGVFVMKTK